jgi:hypothetical protein
MEQETYGTGNATLLLELVRDLQRRREKTWHPTLSKLKTIWKGTGAKVRNV